MLVGPVRALDPLVAMMGQRDGSVIDVPDCENSHDALTRDAGTSVLCSDGGCLPPSAYAWTEGSITAQPVGSLMNGQRVLCYDRLAASLAYDGIYRVQSRPSDSTDGWVSIELEDGTQHMLTSCHPMWPVVDKDAEEPLGNATDYVTHESVVQSQVTEPVSAEMLVPSVHSIMLKKIDPVQVHSVTPLARMEQAKMFILLRDHDRYQILVTQHLNTAHVLLPVGARSELQAHLYAGKVDVEASRNSDAEGHLAFFASSGSDAVDMLAPSGSMASMAHPSTPAVGTPSCQGPSPVTFSGEFADCPEGDCLPAGTFVWTEGSATPQPVGSLKLGHNLLCYDRIAKNVCYAAICRLQLTVAQKSDRWVSIVLQDGTRQDLFASCVLTPKIRKSQTDTFEDDAGPTSAEHLSPTVHSLLVVKTTPVRVTSVSRATGAKRKIAVTLNHPSRYDLLVGHSHHGGGPMIAVGSVPCQEFEKDDYGSSGTSQSVSSNCLTSSDSSQSALSTGTEIIMLAGVTAVRPGMGNAGRRETVLSSHISFRTRSLLNSANLGSLGSLAHQQGNCSMCIFQARYSSGRLPQPCKYGFLCDRCHSDHTRTCD